MILETLALVLSGVTLAAAFMSVLIVMRRSRNHEPRNVSISIRGESGNIHIEASGMSEDEIRRLVESLQVYEQARVDGEERER
ncbi:effector-associated constant component EACC1 [Streptomyces sp. NBC_00190]|uniref:effector-associated constant component EACC1 n=1 Tax=Streptomyces sp. NBC_00190 TaxID=2903634 RepID=UPI003FA6F76D